MVKIRKNVFREYCEMIVLILLFIKCVSLLLMVMARYQMLNIKVIMWLGISLLRQESFIGDRYSLFKVWNR